MGISTLLATASMLAVLSCSEVENTPEPTPTDTRSMTVQESIGIDHAAGPFSVTVEANFAFKAEPQIDWIKFDRVEGDKVWFTAEENGHTTSREGQIRFSDDNDRYYYKVTTVNQAGDPNPTTILSMVDKNATAETKALYANLWKIAESGFMFGHHDDLWYGRYWYNESGKSDTKSVCGDYPGVCSIDFGEMMDERYQYSDRARECVDGQGAVRIADCLVKLQNKDF